MRDLAELDYIQTSRQRTGSIAGAIADVLGGESAASLARGTMDRLGRAWALAKMATLEADRKEAEEICPRSPRRGGRRRRFRHYLEEGAYFSADTIAAALSYGGFAPGK